MMVEHLLTDFSDVLPFAWVPYNSCNTWLVMTAAVRMSTVQYRYHVFLCFNSTTTCCTVIACVLCIQFFRLATNNDV